jgi:hypothetical protein
MATGRNKAVCAITAALIDIRLEAVTHRLCRRRFRWALSYQIHPVEKYFVQAVQSVQNFQAV